MSEEIKRKILANFYAASFGSPFKELFFWRKKAHKKKEKKQEGVGKSEIFKAQELFNAHYTKQITRPYLYVRIYTK